MYDVRINNGMWLMTTKCSNCDNTVKNPETSITVCDESAAALCGEICEDCQKGVLTMKIVLKRASVKEPFKFEQYLPVESEKV